MNEHRPVATIAEAIQSVLQGPWTEGSARETGDDLLDDLADEMTETVEATGATPSRTRFEPVWDFMGDQILDAFDVYKHETKKYRVTPAVARYAPPSDR